MPIPLSNDNAKFSMWLGIATWVCWITTGMSLRHSSILCFTACIAPFTTIAGIVLGHMGFNASKEMSGMGRSEAIAGLVLNYLSLAIYVIVVVGVAIFGISMAELT